MAGPAGACRSTMRRYLDPQRYRIVMYDQRGCGRSMPHASCRANTTWHLVADVERMREQLGIDHWLVFGGSWGSTLALAYAERHPERVSGAGPARHLPAAREELDWFYQGGCQLDVPGGVRGVPQAHPARGAGQHDRGLLPPPHPVRSCATCRSLPPGPGRCGRAAALRCTASVLVSPASRATSSTRRSTSEFLIFNAMDEEY